MFEMSSVCFIRCDARSVFMSNQRGEDSTVQLVKHYTNILIVHTILSRPAAVNHLIDYINGINFADTRVNVSTSLVVFIVTS